MESYKGITVSDLKDIPFPDCSKECPIVGTYGVGECESFCPHKFDKSAVGLKKTCDHYIVETNKCRFFKNDANESIVCDLTPTNPCVGFHKEL